MAVIQYKNITNQLSYKFPDSYIKLMKSQNGGIPKNTCYPTTEKTTWADNNIEITGIMGIGNEKPYSLCGDFISQFWIIRSAENMESQKLYISTKRTTFRKHFLAVNFEAFINGLVNEGN